MASEEQLLRRSLEMLEDVFYIYDERGRLRLWNRRLNELFDRTDEQLAGMTPEAFFVDADRPAVERGVADIFDSGTTVVEAWADTTDGRILFELTGHLLTDSDGSIMGFCGIGRDVTERHERQQALAAQNDRLNNFANVLAHDVRNPLNVAKGYAKLAVSNPDTETIETVATALDRIEQIVDDVLAVAVEGQATIDRNQVELAAVAREAWEMVDTGDGTLDVRTTVSIAADQRRLRRLFENLFRNALEHGGRSVTVTVSETESGFAVSDDGPGIPPEDRNRVFLPGESSRANGTGFGLAIVQSIAEAHGWTVSLADDADRGARFEFTLDPEARLDFAA